MYRSIIMVKYFFEEGLINYMNDCAKKYMMGKRVFKLSYISQYNPKDASYAFILNIE